MTENKLNGNTIREANVTISVYLPSEKESNLQRRNLFPVGAIFFLFGRDVVNRKAVRQ